MLLKIGELAKRTGLTVRTLHHYDALGLLSPSARSDAGYRLYNQADVARLHRIFALRRFGLSLADIGAYLTRPDLPLADVVRQQIAMLTQQIEQADALRTQHSKTKNNRNRSHASAVTSVLLPANPSNRRRWQAYDIVSSRS